MSDYESPILVTHVCQLGKCRALPRYDCPYAQRPQKKEPHKQAFREAIRAQAAAAEEWLRRSGSRPLRLSIACGMELKFLPSTDVLMLQSIYIKIVDASAGGLSSELWERSELLKARTLRKLVAPVLIQQPRTAAAELEAADSSFIFQLASSRRRQSPEHPSGITAIQFSTFVPVSFIRRPPCYSPDHYPPNEDPLLLSLPSLEKLFIGDGAHDLTRLFQVLETPLLRSFTYTTSEKAYRAPLSFEILSSFISRTLGVRKLPIDPEHLTRDEFGEILRPRQCPHLRFLKTSEHCQCPDACRNDSKLINSRLLELFAGTHPTEPGICPGLEEIEWRHCSGFSDDELLISECGGAVSCVAKLKRMHVEFERTK
ncbi:unnamed protein product [Cyclocybe aegerita]|uniref:Uncharacterized protein n=1 Tax=Cyclocybe aegerita TaxID=1973307 RepID=A0A8S0W5J8_CYCAE|nr:unnamed protein product [Cyclocybe aegerita]